MTLVPLPVRMLLTWAAILPLVLLARVLLGPLVADWPDVLALALTVTVVVPVAVAWAVPQLTRLYLAVAPRPTSGASR